MLGLISLPPAGDCPRLRGSGAGAPQTKEPRIRALDPTGEKTAHARTRSAANEGTSRTRQAGNRARAEQVVAVGSGHAEPGRANLGLRDRIANVFDKMDNKIENAIDDAMRANRELGRKLIDQPVRFELDITVRALRNQVAEWRRIGLPLAAEFLERFLDRAGGLRTLSEAEFASYPPLVNAQAENRKRFVVMFAGDSNGKDRDNVREKKDNVLKSLGSSSVIVKDKWNIAIRLVPDIQRVISNPREQFDIAMAAVAPVLDAKVSAASDLGWATGNSEFTSKGIFTLIRDGNNWKVKGEVRHIWNDLYNFNQNQLFNRDGFELQQAGRGKVFEFDGSIIQTLTGVLEGPLVKEENWTLTEP